MNKINILQGKRTIITGVAMIVYAVTGLFLGNIEMNTAVELIGTGAGLIFLRLGIK